MSQVVFGSGAGRGGGSSLLCEAEVGFHDVFSLLVWFYRSSVIKKAANMISRPVSTLFHCSRSRVALPPVVSSLRAGPGFVAGLGPHFCVSFFCYQASLVLELSRHHGASPLASLLRSLSCFFAAQPLSVSILASNENSSKSDR